MALIERAVRTCSTTSAAPGPGSAGSSQFGLRLLLLTKLVTVPEPKQPAGSFAQLSREGESPSRR